MKINFPELKKNILSKNKIVLRYVNNIIKQVNYEFSNEINFGINKNEISFYLKKKLFESFNLKNKFENKISIYSLPKFIFIFLLYTINIFFFKNTKKIAKKKI